MPIAKHLFLIVVVIAACCFGYYVWPFRFEQLNGGLVPMAFDHLRHRRVTMGPNGWEDDTQLGGQSNVEKQEHSEQSRIDKAKSDLLTFRGAIDQFRLDCDRYPTTQEGFDALRNQPSGVSGWHGPYLQKDLTDPWGNPYVYQTPGRNGRDGYLIGSYGADGVQGGDGDNADI